MGWIIGKWDGMRRFFVEAGNPVVFVDRDDAKSGCFFDGDVDGTDHHIRAFGDEPMEHLCIVHFVHMVARKDQ
jgi:hypothetical protein